MLVVCNFISLTLYQWKFHYGIQFVRKLFDLKHRDTLRKRLNYCGHELFEKVFKIRISVLEKYPNAFSRILLAKCFATLVVSSK